MSNNSLKAFLAICGFMLLFSLGQAQNPELSEFNQKRLTTSNRAMYVLGGWAVGNIALGGIQRSRLSGEQKYFHEMNLFWNLVNLGIAGAALYGNAQLDPSSLSLFESLHEQDKLEKILWFNVALNGSYILGGAWLKERSKSATNRPERLKGYGNSLMLQGGFLLVYDLVHVLIQQSQSSDKIEAFLSQVQFSGTGISLRFIF
ncbi:MAG: hypothetical protein R8P61_13890 [Bacteroidia bacterium]|nr:hypothetical protein [Bacteroidia bacterium]